MPSVSRDVEFDFTPTYCSVCDQAHNKRDSLYCSAKCKKLDAKGLTLPTSSIKNSPAASVPMSRSKSGSSIYAQSNPSTTSISSEPRQGQRTSTENTRCAVHDSRPLYERRHSSQRPLPPIKRNSYSSSVPRSVDLVTPLLSPLTPVMRSERTSSPKFTYPVQPAGNRYNHVPPDRARDAPLDAPRRMFFFKRVQSEDDIHHD